jgi:uncharacterized membrane protein
MSPRLRLGGEAEGAGSGDTSVVWQLQRNCSIAPRQLLGVYLSLLAVSLSIAAMFWWQGVPWVLPFASAELLALGVALLVYARHANDGESIRLDGGRLTVEQSVGSRTWKVEFAPAWVRVEPEQGDRSLVELSGQGRRVVVGRHVRPERRRQLAAELRWALRRIRAQAGIDG